jgi:hypothetical protein
MDKIEENNYTQRENGDLFESTTKTIAWENEENHGNCQSWQHVIRASLYRLSLYYNRCLKVPDEGAKVCIFLI